MRNMSPTVAYAPPDPSFDKRFSNITFILLFLVILFSTYIHHFQPQILRVPSNTDVSSWTNPPFEQSVLYDRATAEERQKILSEGIPFGDNLAAQLVTDLFTILLGWMCFVHAKKYFGYWMASCFLIGSFVFTGLEESMWIILGRFVPDGTLNSLGETVYGTYWFTKGVFWFLETPITACIGWFFLAYSCVLVAGKVFPRMNLMGRAAVGGLIAMGIDLWMDPVVTSPEQILWVWSEGDILFLFGIPHTNFVGWFLLIFMFAIFWERLPDMEQKWGRAKATLIFYLIIFGTELCILISFVVWLSALGIVLSFMGFEHTVRIPAGW